MCDSTQGSLCPSPMKIHQSMWIQWPFLQKNLNQRSLTPRWPLTPHLLRSHVWLYPRIIVSKSHENTSKYVDTVNLFAKTWTKGHWPLDDLWPHICWGHMCDSTQRSFPWEYINVCGYRDQFCKLPHTYTTYILHTYYVHTTYRISDHIVSFWTTFRRDKRGWFLSKFTHILQTQTYLGGQIWGKTSQNSCLGADFYIITKMCLEGIFQNHCSCMYTPAYQSGPSGLALGNKSIFLIESTHHTITGQFDIFIIKSASMLLQIINNFCYK